MSTIQSVVLVVDYPHHRLIRSQSFQRPRFLQRPLHFRAKYHLLEGKQLSLLVRVQRGLDLRAIRFAPVVVPRQFHIENLPQILVQVSDDVSYNFLLFGSLLLCELLGKIRESGLRCEHSSVVHLLNRLIQLLSIIHLGLESGIVHYILEDSMAHMGCFLCNRGRKMLGYPKRRQNEVVLWLFDSAFECVFDVFGYRFVVEELISLRQSCFKLLEPTLEVPFPLLWEVQSLALRTSGAYLSNRYNNVLLLIAVCNFHGVLVTFLDLFDPLVIEDVLSRALLHELYEIEELVVLLLLLYALDYLIPIRNFPCPLRLQYRVLLLHLRAHVEGVFVSPSTLLVLHR